MKTACARNPLFPLTLLTVLAAVTPSFGQSASLEAELADIDVAATMLGSIRSWINHEPEAAIHAFAHHDAIRSYLQQRRKQHGSANDNRMVDRIEQIDSALKAWDDAIERLHRDQPKQIATELKRQRDAVARYRKSKSPRPSSFAYVPKTVWQTKNKLDVLTASGFDTADLQEEQKIVQQKVLDLVATLDTEQLAKKNGSIRDAYKRDDRMAIETFVQKAWAKEKPDQSLVRVIIPSQSWSNTYSASADASTGNVLPNEVDRITVYVATKKSDTILTIHPMRLAREHYLVNGERFGKVGPQSIGRISTNEFSFNVLKRNIR